MQSNGIQMLSLRWRFHVPPDLVDGGVTSPIRNNKINPEEFMRSLSPADAYSDEEYRTHVDANLYAVGTTIDQVG